MLHHLSPKPSVLSAFPQLAQEAGSRRWAMVNTPALALLVFVVP